MIVWVFVNLWWYLCACFRWETIILISMYGLYIIIMKWVFASAHISNLKPQHVLYVPQAASSCVVLCEGLTDLCAAWWRDTAAGQVSHVWAVCDGRLLSETPETATMTWCRWNQVKRVVFVHVLVHPKQEKVCQASEQHPADLVTQFKLSV